MKARIPLSLTLASSAVLLALSGQASAAGFQLIEHSAAGLGRAYAGEAAIAQDASVIAHNPAGMSAITAPVISFPTMNIAPDIDVSGAGSAEGVAPSALVPTFYAVYPVNQQLSIGVGGFSNFGLSSEYGKEFEFSNLADKSQITTYNFNPSVSWKFNDRISIGTGLNYVIAKATISSTGTNPFDLALTDQNLFELSGDDTGFGWNIGFLAQLTSTTQVGVSYRSAIDLVLEGNGKSDVYNGANLGPATLPQFNTEGSVDLTLPSIFEVALNHDFTDAIAVHASAQYTGWSSFDELNPVLSNNAHLVADLKTEQNWDDVWRLAAGANWQLTPALQLRAGTAYDQSPTSDEYRTLRIPDSDRFWASIGATWQATQNLSIDAGYSHLFAEKATIVEGDETFDIDASVNIFGLQANWVF